MKTHLFAAYLRSAVTLLAMLFSPCLHGAASLSLNGSNQYAQVPASTNLTPGLMTLEAWVNVPAAGQLTILSRGDGGSASLTDYIFQIGNNGTGVGTKISFFGNGAWASSTSSIPVGVWTHVAVTYDGTNKVFYTNGVQNGSSPSAGRLFTNDWATTPLYIGRQGTNCGCNLFNGQLAEIRIWNTIRTASQIKADMNFTYFGPQPGLMAYYHLNEGAGSTANDASGNAHTGTLVNGASWATTAPPSLGTSTLLEGPGAGTDTVVLYAPAGWTVTTNVSWLHLSPTSQSGTGSTNIVFTFDANTGVTRTGTLTVAGQILTVTQAGANFAATSPITTLISGLNDPQGVAVDASGNVFTVDRNDGILREWFVTSNSVSTLANLGGFFQSAAVDGLGNFYFNNNYSARKWSPVSQTVTTVYSGNPNLNEMGLDGAGNIYFSSNNTILEFVAGSSTWNTVVSSGLSSPTGVAVDRAGNVYIADTGNNALKEWIAASNMVVTLASGIETPNGVAVDGEGNVYIGNSGAVNLIDPSLEEWSAVTHSVTRIYSYLNGYSSVNPHGVAVDGAGNVYFTDVNYGLVRELPRAFVDTTAKLEGPVAGSDSLTVLPATENLLAPFAPTSDQPWLTIVSATNGIVTFAFTNNFGGTRVGNVSVLGQQIQVTQTAASFSLGATNRLEGPSAGVDSIVLATQPVAAPWTATPNAPWLHLSVANQSGAGSTNVVFTFDANAGPTRTGTLTIAGQTLTVTQAGSTYVSATPLTALVSAGLNHPGCVAVDAAGNVYIADTANNALKEWSVASNSVTSLVSSGLNGPNGLAVDSAGNVYIADTTNNAVKEYSSATHTVTTLVSTGLNQPSSVAVDKTSNVYFTESNTNAILEWVAASNTVVVLVSSGLSGPSGLAVDAAGNIYFADTGNGAIKEWSAATRTVTTLVSSGLSTPRGVAVDGSGNVYIADTGNNAIKKWSAANQAITTVLTSGLNAPVGLALDGNGNMYIADSGNSAVKELPQAFVDTTPKSETAAAGTDSTVVLPATENLLPPFAPTTDQTWLSTAGVTNGVVTFAFTDDFNATRIANITLLGQQIPVTQSNALISVNATNLLVGPAAGTNNFVLTVSPAAFPWSATPNASWLHVSASSQSGMGSTNVIFSFDANSAGPRVGTLTIAGQTVTVTQAGATYIPAGAVTLVSQGLNFPGSVAMDGAGNVYIADHDLYYNQTNALKVWSPSSNTLTTVFTTGQSTIGAVAVDNTGNVYFTESNTNAILKWVAASNTIISLVPTIPAGLALDAAGNVYFSSNNAVMEWVAASNTVITLVSSGLFYPQGLVVDPAGNVYIADTDNNAVKVWSAAAHAVTTLVSSGLSQPFSLALDGAGNLYIADYSNQGSVREWSAATHTVTTLIGSGLSQPGGVAVNAWGDVYLSDSFHYALKGLPHAFLEGLPRLESSAAGNDALSVLPVTQNLTGPFAPTSDQLWLPVTGDTNGVVSVSFPANTGYGRMANLFLLGQDVAVKQAGLPNSGILGVASRVEGPAAGTDTVVLASAATPWTATANVPWLHLSAANQSGTDSTNVAFTFDANPGATRSGTVTIAGQTLSVTQAGTNYVAAPARLTTLVSSGLNSPYALAVDGSGNVYIADSGNDAIKEWSVASNSLVTLASSPSVGQAYGVALDAAGNVYIADFSNNAIKEWVAASNTVINLVSSGLNNPQGVAVDAAGNVYIADSGNAAIKEWSAATHTVTTLVSSGLSYPTDVALDAAGNVYIADYNNGRLQEWSAASHVLTNLVSSGLSGPYSLAVDGSGNVYVACFDDGTVKEWSAASRSVTTVVSTDSIYTGIGVAVDAAENVYIADGMSAIEELPRAFVDPTAKSEPAAAGNDALSVVLPVTENLAGPFAPASDQPWLTITGVTNDVVSFAFTGTTSNRTAHITLLGQNISVNQSVIVGMPVALGGAQVSDGTFQFTFTNTPGATFTVLTTTNVALPLSSWTRIDAPVEASPGQYRFTAAPATNAQSFYRLRSP